MTTLNDYLAHKRGALDARRARLDAGELGPHALQATVTAEGRSGVRRIRIRDFQVLSDSPPDFAGYDLGPSSPELQLGVLGSCLTHTFLIQAAALGVRIDSLEIEVSARLDPRAGRPGHADVPIYPHDIRYAAHIASPDGEAAIAELTAAVERHCPILNLLRAPQSIAGTVRHLPVDDPQAA